MEVVNKMMDAGLKKEIIDRIRKEITKLKPKEALYGFKYNFRNMELRCTLTYLMVHYLHV